MADKFLKMVNGVLVEGEADHGGLAGLGDDDHSQYPHLTRTGGQLISGGQVLIGPLGSSPSYKLHVKGTTDSDSRIAIEGTAVDSNVFLSIKNDGRVFLFGVAGFDSDAFIIFDETAEVARLKIAADGKFYLTGGKFHVDENGDLKTLKNINYSWPSGHVAGLLKNNGSGTLSWESGFILGSGVAKITVGTTAPSSPSTGDLWVDTN
jgi:hypothetical protein